LVTLRQAFFYFVLFRFPSKQTDGCRHPLSLPLLKANTWTPLTEAVLHFFIGISSTLQNSSSFLVPRVPGCVATFFQSSPPRGCLSPPGFRTSLDLPPYRLSWTERYIGRKSVYLFVDPLFYPVMAAQDSRFAVF